MKKVTVDSSVIISSLLKQEPRHREALKIWERVLSGKDLAILPYSVLVEVTAAIRRRTGSEELALQVKGELMKIKAVSFAALDEQSAAEAADIAGKTGVRGMDALVIQVSKEFGSELITFDNEIIQKAGLFLKD